MCPGQLLAGVSTRRFARTREPVGEQVEQVARSTSRSAVSREFVSRTRDNLLGLMGRRLDDVRLAVLMLDGIELKGRCCVVALGITTDGVKVGRDLISRVTDAVMDDARRVRSRSEAVASRSSGRGCGASTDR